MINEGSRNGKYDDPWSNTSERIPNQDNYDAPWSVSSSPKKGMTYDEPWDRSGVPNSDCFGSTNGTISSEAGKTRYILENTSVKHFHINFIALLPILAVPIAYAMMIVANSNPIHVLFLIRSETKPNLQRPSLSNPPKCHIDVQDPLFLPDMFHNNGLRFVLIKRYWVIN